MKLLALDQFVSVLKLVTYSMLTGMAFLFMGLELNIGPVILFGSIGLIIAHITHQSLFNRFFSQRSRMVLCTLAFSGLFTIVGAAQLDLQVTASVCAGFLLSFCIDIFTEKHRNRATEGFSKSGARCFRKTYTQWLLRMCHI